LGSDPSVGALRRMQVKKTRPLPSSVWAEAWLPLLLEQLPCWGYFEDEPRILRVPAGWRWCRSTLSIPWLSDIPTWNSSVNSALSSMFSVPCSGIDRSAQRTFCDFHDRCAADSIPTQSQHINQSGLS
jgi:hypothetical protein